VDFARGLFLQFLQYTHQFTHNYGWDIIILTIAVRIVLLPLTLSSIRGMKAMQHAQPRMKELQEKFKDDKERMNKEMMALYKEIGFNPISGCLPMLLQIPVFIILFQVLRNPEQNGFIFVNTSFYGMDLSTFAFNRISPDFLYNLHFVIPGMVDLSRLGIGFFYNTYLYVPALPVVAVMCITTIIQQKMMTVDPQQKNMMWMMNFMIIYFAFMMPTGVLLYWGVSNVLQLIQQAFTKTTQKQEAAAHKTLGGPSSPKSASAASGGKKVKTAKDNINVKPEKPVLTYESDSDEDDEDEETDDAESSQPQKTSPSSSLTGKTKKSYPAQKKTGSKKRKKKKR